MLETYSGYTGICKLSASDDRVNAVYANKSDPGLGL